MASLEPARLAPLAATTNVPEVASPMVSDMPTDDAPKGDAPEGEGVAKGDAPEGDDVAGAAAAAEPPKAKASAQCLTWAAAGECERNRGYSATGGDSNRPLPHAPIRACHVPPSPRRDASRSPRPWLFVRTVAKNCLEACPSLQE